MIGPRSRLTGATPVPRETEHYFLLLPKLADPLLDWLKSRRGWRKHVQNMAIGFVEEGLIDRAITRDLDWGIPIPPEADTLGPGKRIYVWFEAVIGYLSAAKEWAQRTGDPEAWRAWWENPDAESYYFIGKDNVVFHTVVWPAMLIGYQGLNLPTDVPANQYITFRGAKASKSMGVGRSIGWYAERLQSDAIRYAIASVLPEQSDTDLSDEEIIRRVNDELVATWGNLVNRVVSLVHRHFEGRIPEPFDLDPADSALLERIDRALTDEAALIEAVELRAGLRAAMEAAAGVNAYLNATEPWRTAKDDRARTATTLFVALQAISGLRTAFAPYLPFSTESLGEMLSLPPLDTWTRPEIAVRNPARADRAVVPEGRERTGGVGRSRLSGNSPRRPRRDTPHPSFRGGASSGTRRGPADGLAMTGDRPRRPSTRRSARTRPRSDRSGRSTPRRQTNPSSSSPHPPS